MCEGLLKWELFENTLMLGFVSENDFFMSAETCLELAVFLTRNWCQSNQRQHRNLPPVNFRVVWCWLSVAARVPEENVCVYAWKVVTEWARPDWKATFTTDIYLPASNSRPALSRVLPANYIWGWEKDRHSSPADVMARPGISSRPALRKEGDINPSLWHPGTKPPRAWNIVSGKLSHSFCSEASWGIILAPNCYNVEPKTNLRTHCNFTLFARRQKKIWMNFFKKVLRFEEQFHSSKNMKNNVRRQCLTELRAETVLRTVKRNINAVHYSRCH